MLKNNFVASKITSSLPANLFSSPFILSSPPSTPNHNANLTSESSAKRRRVVSSLCPHATVEVSANLGTYVNCDVKLLKEMGWKSFVRHRRQRGDFAEVTKLPHPASRLLQHYKVHGAPVKLTTKPWKKHTVELALAQGPHPLCMEHIDFLHEEFIDMINKQQWVVLPYSEAKHLLGLQLTTCL